MNDWAGVLVTAMVGLIVLRGLLCGGDAYGAFLRGGAQGFKSAAALLPALCAMLLMLQMMNASGLMHIITRLLSPITGLAGLPQEVIPMLVLRPLTGSGSLTALQQIILQCGVDSRAARLAAVMMGSSETIFYTVTVYLGATDIRRLPWVMPISLVSYLVSVIVAGLMV